MQLVIFVFISNSMNWKKENTDENKKIQLELMNSGKLPDHLAIIMDGNGRWAKQRKIPRLSGHREGIESVREIVRSCSQMNLSFLTLYAFSIENWKRPLTEVNGLMKLLETFLKKDIDEMHENKVRLKTIGRTSSLPKEVQRILHDCMERTKDNEGLTLTLALSYGARWDIVRASQLISMDVRRGKLSPEDITEETFSNYLNTEFLPDPDLLIRTSGEYRLSNFLLWEMAYGELYITEKLWPKFRKEDLYLAFYDYLNRERRFGKISEQIQNEPEDDKRSYLQKIADAFRNS